MIKLKYQFYEQENLPVKTGLNENKFYFYAVYNTKNGASYKSIISVTKGTGTFYRFLSDDKIAFLFKATVGYDLPVRFRLSPQLLILKEIFMESEIYDGLKATTNRGPTQASSGTSKATSSHQSK